ncbi:MAG TPA: carboxypeptidase regulatory-like domain-containing protein [Pyrinomonadaceae bacterium]|nr:carboxypeptidase regulatory-like domain-containing protein [Pyrinomonadaceae bacterium]
MSQKTILHSFQLVCFVALLSVSSAVSGQALSAGTVAGVILDPNNAAVPNANVTITNSVTGYTRSVTSNTDGTFRFDNVPPNNYQLSVAATGFATAAQNVSVRTSVPINVKIPLAVGNASETVNIMGMDAPDALENVSSTHTDVDQNLIKRMPVRQPGNGLSELVTLAAPGVVADSNGFYHPLGDHAQSTISLDNQPISDQQSKAFSTQIPVNAIQSLEVVTGAAQAEYGDKTSLVINATTHSGLNQKKPTGSFNALYGSFGMTHEDAALAYGNAKGGNFVAFNFDRSNRFLDSPEFTSLHNHGTAVNIFDRIDYSPNQNDTFHLNLFLARNRFQTPNEFDQQDAGQDQRQLVNTINIAPGYVHIFSPTTVLAINPYYRVDTVKYFGSPNPFSDEPITFSQSRRLNNVGIKTDLSYTKGIHNAKVGVQLSHTFLTEGFQFGITDPDFNDPASPDFLPGLLPFDLTRGGTPFGFHGHTDIKQEAVYAQDTLTLGNATVSLGLRFDNYNGITHGKLLQPRLGLSYLVKRTNTVLRGSYTRNFETPYNENLVLSSATGAGGLGNGILGDTSNLPLLPGRRHQFNVGFQQAIGSHLILDGDYFYKRTNNAYDFNVLFNTSVTFPISWQMSKLDGVSARINLTNYKGLSAFMVAGHTRSRYFPPESGGLFFNSDLPAGVFRIDHDQAFQQTTQAQYQFQQWKRLAPYVAFTWRYDSGLVSGAVSDFDTALTFSADQQAQIGLFCGNTFATPMQAITTCTDANRGALRVRIPADATANDDHNPPRIAPRHLFDFSAGTDNLFRTEHVRTTLRFTILNLTNKEALYNFQSTFSGTHFVAPRSYQGQIGITF